MSRIIVASGGGGANSYAEKCSGGCGGIIQGEDGYRNGVQANVVEPKGGTQNSGGARGFPTQDTGNTLRYGTPGTFGSGGNSANDYYGSGGGGGYFGGGGGADSPSATSSGAGGSSYISGYPGCLAIDKSTTSISNPIMLTNSYHYSGHVFQVINVKEGKELNRNEDGYAKITFLFRSNYSCARNIGKHSMFLTTLLLAIIVGK